MADGYIDISRAGVLTIAANATPEATHSYVHQPEEILEPNIVKVCTGGNSQGGTPWFVSHHACGMRQARLRDPRLGCAPS